jgi:hypothetical protein
MTQGAKRRLLNYVRIDGSDENFHLELIVPLRNWPIDLYNEFGWMVRVVKSLELAVDLIEFPQKVAFCRDLCGCPSKAGSTDNPSCPRNCLGICCDATFSYNDGAIPCRALGRIFGLSPARIQQLQAVATAKVRRLVMADPSLVEMCAEFNIRGGMPSSEQIASELETLAGI